jgi:Tfp pilus assembly protein PilO
MTHIPSTTIKLQIIGLALLLVAIISGYVYLFLMIKRDNLESSRILHETELQLVTFFDLNEQSDAFEAYAKERHRLDDAIIHEEETAVFFDHIENIATEVGIDFDVIGAEAADELLLQIEASGSFAEVYTFFRALESIPFSVTLTRVNLGQADQTTHHDMKEELSVWQGIFDLTLHSFIPRS